MLASLRVLFERCWRGSCKVSWSMWRVTNLFCSCRKLCAGITISTGFRDCPNLFILPAIFSLFRNPSFKLLGCRDASGNGKYYFKKVLQSKNCRSGERFSLFCSFSFVRLSPLLKELSEVWLFRARIANDCEPLQSLTRAGSTWLPAPLDALGFSDARMGWLSCQWKCWSTVFS